MNHSRARRLIVSADDFGLSAGVNAGIIRAHREGILTDASLMVNGQAFEEAVALARAHPSLSVGLHLMLLQGRAVLPRERIPHLVDGVGMFGTNPIWTGLRYFFTPGIREQLRREIVAQLEKFAATGLLLSHVDGHLTIHMHPTVVRILLEVADHYHIQAVRLPREPLGPALRFDRRHLARKLFEAAAFASLSRYAQRHLARARVHHPDRMFGLHQTGQVSEEYILSVLRHLPAGVNEVYCHPAIPDDESRRWRPPHYDSARELAALTSPRVRAALEESAIVPMSYRDLTCRGSAVSLPPAH